MARNEAKPANDSIKQALLNPDHTFSEDELQAIIEGEFAADTDRIDTVLIDLATSRLLLLQGKALTEENLLQAQEQNAKRMLSRALGIAD